MFVDQYCSVVISVELGIHYEMVEVIFVIVGVFRDFFWSVVKWTLYGGR